MINIGCSANKTHTKIQDNAQSKAMAWPLLELCLRNPAAVLAAEEEETLKWQSPQENLTEGSTNNAVCKNKIRLLVSNVNCDTEKSLFGTKVRSRKFLTTAGSISIFQVVFMQLQKMKACNIKNHDEHWQPLHCTPVSKQMLKHLYLIRTVNAIFSKMHVEVSH